MNICLRATLQSIKATPELIVLSAQFKASDSIKEFSERLIEIKVLRGKESEIVGRATSLMTNDCKVFEIHQECTNQDFKELLCQFVNVFGDKDRTILELDVLMQVDGDSIPKVPNKISLDGSYGIYTNVTWEIVC